MVVNSRKTIILPSYPSVIAIQAFYAIVFERYRIWLPYLLKVTFILLGLWFIYGGVDLLFLETGGKCFRKQEKEGKSRDNRTFRPEGP